MTDEARFLKKKKKFRGPNLSSTGLHQAENEVFRYFVGFGSLVFLEIAYRDSLQQCLTSSRGKIHEKEIRGPNLDQNRARN